MKQYLNLHTGYLTIKLQRKNFDVHRLIAKAFIVNPKNKLYVNHIDANKQNNKVVNLEWVTAQENILHTFKLGNKKHRAIIQYDAMGKFIKIWKSTLEATIVLNIGTVYSISEVIRKGPGYSFAGFQWRYYTEDYENNIGISKVMECIQLGKPLRFGQKAVVI